MNMDIGPARMWLKKDLRVKVVIIFNNIYNNKFVSGGKKDIFSPVFSACKVI